MKSIILLNSNENTSLVEKEEQARFVRAILTENFEIPLIADLWEADGSMTVENKIKLRTVLSTYNIQIIDDSDGGLQIYCDGKKVAQWNKCEYILKRDLKEKDPAKKLYLEMQINCWSTFDNQEEGNA
jgi:hypothetical protein